MQAGQVGGGGGGVGQPAGDFHQLAIQVARLDERSLGLQRQIDLLIRLVGGLYGLVLVGFTVIGWLVTRPH
jgi:hypothetical protein